MNGPARWSLVAGLVLGFALGLLVATSRPPLVILRDTPVAPGPPGPAPSPAPRVPAIPPVESEEIETLPAPGTVKEAEPADGEVVAPAAPERPRDPDAEGPYDREKRIRGALRHDLKVRVVDAETGAPMPGVEVSFFVGTFRNGGSSSWGRTKADGMVAADPLGLIENLRNAMARGGSPKELDFRTIGSEKDPLRADVRIRVPGFKPFVAPATGESLDVRLERDRNPRPFGALAGRVLAADGSPFTEPFELSLQDPEVLDSFTTWVLPGPDGRFHQAGLPAGNWGAKVNDGWGPRVAVEIPPGGVAEAEVRAPDERSRGEGLPGKRRPVVVTLAGRDLPFGGAVLLDGEWGAPLRAEAIGGRASFPAVPAGTVRVVLRRPDGGDEVTAAMVVEGEGSLEIPFPPPR